MFVHVPKTGGRTLTTLFAGQLRAITPGAEEETVTALRSLSREQLARLDVVSGHFPFGLHEHVDRPVTYATMLRHPVSRIVSHYWYVRAHPEHYLHAAVVGDGLTLLDYAERGGALSSELENGQVRFFSASARTRDAVDRDALEEAKAVLRERFAVVGVTERFDESLVVGQRALGLRRPVYVRQNVGSGPRTPLDPETRHAIERRNALDLELYALACELLDDAIRGFGPGFATALRRFRRRNAVYGALHAASPRLARAAFTPGHAARSVRRRLAFRGRPALDR